MKHGFLHTIIIRLLPLMAALSVSCSREGRMPSGEEMTLGIGFNVPVRAAGDDYEDGEMSENYIDIANGDYRIYFFDTENKLIARFESEVFVKSENENYTQYSMLGRVPVELVSHSSFKIVVLANWKQYGDGSITTIDDICNADWAQFDCLTDGATNPTAVALNPAEGKLMPFYGVHTYSDITFTPGMATILQEPVTLLRAMAKVEVLLETEGSFNLSFSSLTINRYNARGYCAPQDVFSSTENYSAASPHLLDDKNDDGQKDLACLKVRQWDGEGGKRYEKWIAYLPEYRNIGVGEGYSSIKAMFNIQQDGTPHTIYFADYSDGTTTNSDDVRRNIERNSIYRFFVTCTGYKFQLFLSVNDWEGTYQNNFSYGNGQFTTPIAPWTDEIDNEVEF